MKSNILLLGTVLAATAALVSLVPVNALAEAGNAASSPSASSRFLPSIIARALVPPGMLTPAA